MSRPGFEPRPPAWEASTLEKSHLDSLSAGYSEPLLSRHLLTTFGPLQYASSCTCDDPISEEDLQIFPESRAVVIPARRTLLTLAAHLADTTKTSNGRQRKVDSK
jgi:hypothetical protein